MKTFKTTHTFYKCEANQLLKFLTLININDIRKSIIIWIT